MGTVTTMIGWITAAIVGLTVLEIGPVCSWLAPKVVRWSAGRLPEKHREIRENEWLAELAGMDSGMKLTRLAYALGTIAAVFKMRRTPSMRAALRAETSEEAGSRGVFGGPATHNILAAPGGRGTLVLANGEVKKLFVQYVNIGSDPATTFRLPPGSTLFLDDEGTFISSQPRPDAPPAR